MFFPLDSLFSSRPNAIHRFNASDMAVLSQYIFLELDVLYFAPEPEIKKKIKIYKIALPHL